MDTIRVFLAEDHPMMRNGIRRLLEREPEIELVGEACTGTEALERVRKLRPDVLVLDMQLPDLSGVEVARCLHKERHPVHILALSAYDDRHFIEGVLANGAAGYLIKDEHPRTFLKALRGVARGERGWLSAIAMERLHETESG